MERGITMATILADMHQAHKARQLRIQQAAYRELTATSSGIDIVEPVPGPEPEPPIAVIETRVPGYAFNIVMGEICSHFNVRPEDLLSNRRLNNISLPRHIMAYLLCRLTKYNTYQIAPKMNRDPATIFYAFKKIEGDLERYREHLDILEPKLRGLLPRP